MLLTDRARMSLRLLGPAATLVVAMAAVSTPGHASSVPQARLVRCGAETCLRVSGHRPQANVAVRIAGRDVAVEGGRGWRVTVPVATARGWVAASGGSLPVALIDTASGSERVREVALPPGALGRRVELAMLVVRAH